MVSPLEVHALYEDLTLDIEVLLSNEQGRDGLFPNLVGRPNIRPAQLDERRERAARHLEILFCKHISVERVKSPAMVTLRQVFRRTAVIQAENPALLEGEPRPFDREILWPKPLVAAPIVKPITPTPPVAPVVEIRPAEPKQERLGPTTATPPLPGDISIRLTGIRDATLRERLGAVFAAHLAEAEQATLMLLFGLDGLGARNYREIGRDLGISQKHARNLAIKTLTKLRLFGAIGELETLAAQAARLAS